MRWPSIHDIKAAVRRLPGAALLLSFAAVAIHAIPSLAASLQFEPHAVATGQGWRLITGHWPHWSAQHLWWDAVVFLVLSIICERRGRLRYLACVVASALSISLVLYLTQTGAMTYRGLPGIDSALFVLLLGLIVREQFAARGWAWIAAALLLFAAFLAKLGYELTTGATVFVDNTAGGFVPLPLAHAIGAAVGLLSAIFVPAGKAAGQRVKFNTLLKAGSCRPALNP